MNTRDGTVALEANDPVCRTAAFQRWFATHLPELSDCAWEDLELWPSTDAGGYQALLRYPSGAHLRAHVEKLPPGVPA